MVNKERTIFNGWEPVPGKPGEYRAAATRGFVTPEFRNFTEESRTGWNLIEWIKVKMKQSSGKKP